MKKLFIFMLVLFIGFAIFADAFTEIVSTVLQKTVGTIGLAWYEYLVPIVVVLVVEYLVKRLICKSQTTTIFKIIYTISPLLVAVLGYVIVSLIWKFVMIEMIKHGITIGAWSVLYYDAIFSYFFVWLKEIKETKKIDLQKASDDMKKIVTNTNEDNNG